METINILGTKIHMLTMEQTVNKVMELMEDGKPHAVFTPNSEMIQIGYKEPEFAEVLNSADIRIADGIGVVYASKILGKPLAERVAGFDMSCELIKRCAPLNKRIFLFGSKPGVAEKAAQKLETDYPGIVIAGTRNGYFKDEDTDDIINQINEANPDILLVCLGMQKQERWILANKDRLNANIMIGAGGSLDVLAGTVERAPESWQKLGLEWAYRLKKEPWRIGRMSALPVFGLTVLFKGRKFK